MTNALKTIKPRKGVEKVSEREGTGRGWSTLYKMLTAGL